MAIHPRHETEGATGPQEDPLAAAVRPFLEHLEALENEGPPLLGSAEMPPGPARQDYVRLREAMQGDRETQAPASEQPCEHCEAPDLHAGFEGIEDVDPEELTGDAGKSLARLVLEKIRYCDWRKAGASVALATDLTPEEIDAALTEMDNEDLEHGLPEALATHLAAIRELDEAIELVKSGSKEFAEGSWIHTATLVLARAQVALGKAIREHRSLCLSWGQQHDQLVDYAIGERDMAAARAEDTIQYDTEVAPDGARLTLHGEGEVEGLKIPLHHTLIHWLEKWCGEKWLVSETEPPEVTEAQRILAEQTTKRDPKKYGEHYRPIGCKGCWYPRQKVECPSGCPYRGNRIAAERAAEPETPPRRPDHHPKAVQAREWLQYIANQLDAGHGERRLRRAILAGVDRARECLDAWTEALMAEDAEPSPAEERKEALDYVPLMQQDVEVLGAAIELGVETFGAGFMRSTVEERRSALVALRDSLSCVAGIRAGLMALARTAPAAAPIPAESDPHREKTTSELITQGCHPADCDPWCPGPGHAEPPGKIVDDWTQEVKQSIDRVVDHLAWRLKCWHGAAPEGPRRLRLAMCRSYVALIQDQLKELVHTPTADGKSEVVPCGAEPEPTSREELGEALVQLGAKVSCTAEPGSAEPPSNEKMESADGAMNRCPKCGAHGLPSGMEGIVNKKLEAWFCSRKGCPRTWEAAAPIPAEPGDLGKERWEAYLDKVEEQTERVRMEPDPLPEICGELTPNGRGACLMPKGHEERCDNYCDKPTEDGGHCTLAPGHIGHRCHNVRPQVFKKAAEPEEDPRAGLTADGKGVYLPVGKAAETDPPGTRYDVECQWCGETFTTEEEDEVICSKECEAASDADERTMTGAAEEDLEEEAIQDLLAHAARRLKDWEESIQGDPSMATELHILHFHTHLALDRLLDLESRGGVEPCLSVVLEPESKRDERAPIRDIEDVKTTPGVLSEPEEAPDCPGCVRCGPPVAVKADDGCDGSGYRAAPRAAGRGVCPECNEPLVLECVSCGHRVPDPEVPVVPEAESQDGVDFNVVHPKPRPAGCRLEPCRPLPQAWRTCIARADCPVISEKCPAYEGADASVLDEDWCGACGRSPRQGHRDDCTARRLPQPPTACPLREAITPPARNLCPQVAHCLLSPAECPAMERQTDWLTTELRDSKFLAGFEKELTKQRCEDDPPPSPQARVRAWEYALRFLRGAQRSAAGARAAAYKAVDGMPERLFIRHLVGLEDELGATLVFLEELRAAESEPADVTPESPEATHQAAEEDRED